MRNCQCFAVVDFAILFDISVYFVEFAIVWTI